MRDFNNENKIIRHFLLGQLAENETQQLEDRIFAEPDFAEEVQIVEDELIAEHRSGTLSPEELRMFWLKYGSSSVSRGPIEFDDAFTEFIRSKEVRDNFATALNSSEPRVAGPGRQENSSYAPPTLAGKGSAFYALISAHPVATYVTLFAFLFLLTFGLWYLSRPRSTIPTNDDLAQAARRAIEADLAQLNTTAAIVNHKDALVVDLTPTERNKGILKRIAVDKGNEDRLIEFRLDLEQASVQPYRALFLDDKHAELFAIGNLMSQDTPNGPEVWLVAPAKYFKRGDYQIELSVSSPNGLNQIINSYAFRLLDPK
jgi:hypothetical protein